MLSNLIDQARGMRNPFITGYAILLAVWVCWADDIPTRTELRVKESPIGAFARALDEIGLSGRAGLLSVAAYAVGAFALRLVPTVKWKWAIDWEELLRLRRAPVISYERNRRTIQVPGSKQSGTTTRTETEASAMQIELARDEVQQVLKARSEISFRLTLIFSLILVAAVSLLAGGWKYLWILAPVPVAILDVVLLRHPMRSVDKAWFKKKGEILSHIKSGKLNSSDPKKDPYWHALPLGERIVASSDHWAESTGRQQVANPGSIANLKG